MIWLSENLDIFMQKFSFENFYLSPRWFFGGLPIYLSSPRVIGGITLGDIKNSLEPKYPGDEIKHREVKNEIFGEEVNRMQGTRQAVSSNEKATWIQVAFGIEQQPNFQTFLFRRTCKAIPPTKMMAMRSAHSDRVGTDITAAGDVPNVPSTFSRMFMLGKPTLDTAVGVAMLQSGARM